MVRTQIQQSPSSEQTNGNNSSGIAAYLDEWVSGSGVTEAIATLNLEALSDNKEIARRLGWKAYHHTPGWWVSGIDPVTGLHQPFGQFKPDTPIQFPDTDKPAKYLTPKIPYDAICLNVGDENYWQAILDDPSIPIAITEGAKKAAALISSNYQAIALCGVEMGLIDGKKLVPTLEQFAVTGRPIILVFDADIMMKSEVRKALIKLATALKRSGCLVFVTTWDIELGKGIDDVLVNRGIEAVDEIIKNPVLYSQWLKSMERQFANLTDSPIARQFRKIPRADMIAHEIAQEYRDQLAYNEETGRWMRYSADFPGMWSAETDTYFESIILHIVNGKGIMGYGSHSYITNIVKALRGLLAERKWVEASPNELLPFRNGVLEIATGKLLPHDPRYRLTWQLPRNHDPLAIDWNRINTFLDHLSNRNAAIKDILLAFCNAVLKGRSDLQKFLHLIGLAGSGKGTFARLLADLIGADNICSTTLEDWCCNRFESANAYRKRLVVFWDEDKHTGKLGKFLSLTGGDWIRAEEKGKKALQYRYDGMVVVCSNLPIFTGDAASRIQRRVITVPCNNPVPAAHRRDLNVEFQSELDAFTNYVLSIPDEHVTKVLMGIANIPECSQSFWENRIRVDSIAAWINDWVIYDPLAMTPIGSDKEEGLNGNPRTLYGSYCLHCKQSGTAPKANKNFSPDLLELCRSVLGWEVERKVTKTGKFIRGLRLRTDGDGLIPTYDYYLMQRVKGGDGLGDRSGDGSDDELKPKQDNSLSLENGLSPISQENKTEKVQSEYEFQAEKIPFNPAPIEPSKNNGSNPSSPRSPAPEPDWDSFPHPTSNCIQAKRNRATLIKTRMLAANTREELQELYHEFSKAEMNWVYQAKQGILTKAERHSIWVASKTSQLSLFEEA
jgi:putative DNA primase/helicase